MTALLQSTQTQSPVYGFSWRWGCPRDLHRWEEGWQQLCHLHHTLVTLHARPVLQPNRDIWRKWQWMACISRDQWLFVLPASHLLLSLGMHKAADAQTKVGIIYSSQAWSLIVWLPKYEFKKEEIVTATLKVSKDKRQLFDRSLRGSWWDKELKLLHSKHLPFILWLMLHRSCLMPAGAGMLQSSTCLHTTGTA